MAGSDTLTIALEVCRELPPPLPRARPEVPPIPQKRRRRRSRPATLPPGQRIGAWRVDYELGRGGMAAVYAVTHNGFGKRAALKLCHTSILKTDFAATTFLREARIVHLVDHPGVPDVFATGTLDGRPYLAMERLTGETLGHMLDRAPIARTEAIEIAIELCDVLAAAHRAGVVHRDLKLDNVFVLDRVGEGGRRTKLFDWGVARILGEDDPMHGMLAGTLTYVAPEQIRTQAVTAAADVYSLGVLCYQMLFGQPPFASQSDRELLQKHLFEPPPPPSTLWHNVPDELATTLVAMLAKDPADRPSLREVDRVLRTTLRQLRPQRESWLRATTRKRLISATVGIACVIAAALAMFGA